MRSSLALLVTSLATLGCGSTEGPLCRPEPEPRVGSQHALTGSTIDLGAVPARATVELDVEVTNAGPGTLAPPRFEHGVFIVVGDAPFPLESGGSGTFRVSATTGDAGTQLSDALLFDRDAACGAPFHFELVAHAVAVDCPVAASLDFGVCPRGETLEASLALSNDAGVTNTMTWSDLAAPFSTLTSSPLSIAPGATGELRVRYTPTQSVTDTATLTLHTPGCADAAISLSASAVDQALTWTPATADFGAVASGSSTLQVTFVNHVTRPVTLSQLRTFQGAVPATDFSLTVTELELPPATGPNAPSSRTLDVTFDRADAGVSTGTLRANTSLANQASIVVPLRGERP